MATPPFLGKIQRELSTPVFEVVWNGQGPLPGMEISDPPEVGWGGSGSFQAIRTASVQTGSWVRTSPKPQK